MMFTRKLVAVLFVAFLMTVPLAHGMGYRPLHLAARNGDVVRLRLLLPQQPPSFWQWMWELVKTHLYRYRDDANVRDAVGRTPLHLAAFFNQIEAARLLLERGADVNAKCRRGLTPLYKAVIQGNTEVARLLLAHGATVMGTYGEDRWGRRQDTLLHLALKLRHGQIAQVLLEHGASVDAVADWRRPPLSFAHFGRSMDDVQTVRALLEHGADANAQKDDYDPPPLHCALGSPQIMELLLAHGADCDRIFCHRKPLHSAAESELPFRFTAVRLLLAHGAESSSSPRGLGKWHEDVRSTRGIGD